MNPDLEKHIASGKIEQAVAEQIDQLTPGAFCVHKSWGVGKIVEWDLPESRIIIDFEGKPGHSMALKFAASSLEPLEENHFLSKRHSQLDELKALAAEDPVALVRDALQSSGGTLKLVGLESLIMGTVVADSDYKKWWDGAKRKLRADHSFVVPSKRNEPLELRDESLSPADALLEDYSAARDLKLKVKCVDAILKKIAVFEDLTQLKPVIADIDDSARKALKLHLPQAVELILVRRELQGKHEELASEEGAIDIAELLTGQKDRLGELFKEISLSRQRLLIAELPGAFGEEWVQEALGLLDDANARTVQEIATLLAEKEKADYLHAFLVKGLSRRSLSSEVLVWICKEREGAAKSVFSADLASGLIHVLERDHGESGRRNRVHDVLLNDMDLIPDLVRAGDLNTVRNFARRLMMSSVFRDLDRRSLMARIVKIHPEVQELITGKDKDVEDEVLIVSEASHLKKKAEFADLVNKQIPENRKDIQIAREYGDLSENFEYKSAKEYQRVLMRRQDDIEGDLANVKQTDFSDVDATTVSIGTVVTLDNKAVGGTETYTILGAWDSDPDKGILSYISERARTLLNRKEGELVQLPTGPGGALETFQIVSIKAYKNQG
ncbi:MAG: GreA/GreB family elongation factor [Verrucomicrobiales bacterium]|nr:GreA/GreB family elongation factor [Verrucomicrobiales bacterium]